MADAPRPPPRPLLVLGLALVVLATGPGVGRTAAGGGPSPLQSPITLVVQPDAANGTDTHVLAGTPTWNFGGDPYLLVGPDAATGLARSLLRFDVSAVPPGSTLVDARLELYRASGTAGTVQVRRAMAPWTEGAGARGWARIPVVVAETAGVPRVNEPVGIALTFPPGAVLDPARDVRVWSGPLEVPSQVYAYGYTGGNVTSATLFFPASVGALANRTYHVTYSANGTAVPAYRTKSWGATPLWQYGPVGGGTSGATIVDLDRDGRLDVVFGTRDGYVRVLNETGASKWAVRLSTNQAIPYTPQVADMDGDGRNDILVFVNDPAVVRLNETGAVVWTRTYAVGSILYSTPTLVDVNGDGVLDVLVGGRFNYLEALSGVNGATIRTYPSSDWTYTATLHDIEGDGVPEIFFASDDRTVHAYRLGGASLWASAPAGTSFIETSVAIGDVDGDGAFEAVTGDDQINGPTFALRAATGAVAWSRSLPSYREGGLTLADLNGDGTLETLIGVLSGAVYALNGADGTIRWTLAGGTTQAMSPAVTDLDRDGRPDLVILDQGTTVRVVNATGSVIHSWTVTANNYGLRTLSQKPMATAAIADLDGDGTLEVVVPTGSGLTAFGTGALARDWRTWGYNWRHTHRAYDGASPSGAALLGVTVGAPETFPGAGASWGHRDGTTPWATPGGDFTSPEAASVGTAGWMAWNVTSIVRDWVSGTFPNTGVFLTEANEGAGGRHAFASSDGADPLQAPRLVLTYVPPDPTPRILGPIPDLLIEEDAPPRAVDLSSFAFDPDTPASGLRWNLTGVPAWLLSVSGTNVPGNHVLTLVPRPDAWGSARVTYWLTDRDGNVATTQAWINVTPVNDRPRFDPPATLVVRYDSPYRFDYGPYISDVDTPRALLTLTSDDPVRAAVTGFNVTYRYPQSLLNQWVFVALTVSDGSLSAAKIVAVKVTSDNPPVVVRPLPDLTLYEDEFRPAVFDLDDYFADPDNDALFYSFGYSHLNITIHQNHSVDVKADAEWSGQEQVTFRGTDRMGAMAEDTIIVTVLPVDDPPSIGPVPNLRVRFDEPYVFNLVPYLEDPDTPLEDLVSSTSSAFIRMSGHLMTLRYPATMNGTAETVTISVTDGTSTANRTISVTVTWEWPPSLVAKMPDSQFLEDGQILGAYDLTTYFADPDSTQLFYSSGQRNVRVTILPSGVVNLAAAPDWFGVERITFRATDAGGGLAEDTVIVRVIPVNDAPRFLTIPVQESNAKAFYLDLTDYVVDVDNEPDELTIVTASSEARVVGRGLLFNFSGDGEHAVEVFVSDGLLTNRTTVIVRVMLPVTIEEVIPAYFWWIPPGVIGLAFAAFVVYRRRQLEWAILVNRAGILISSVARKEASVLDTDLLTGMLTAIMDFARTSFSDESERNLEGLELGDKHVAIARSESCYLAVVYRGRAPGSLPRIMRGLVEHIEARHGERIQDIIDPSDFVGIPVLLNRLLRHGWWPFLSFEEEPSPI